jgi:hypothetical protein
MGFQPNGIPTRSTMGLKFNNGSVSFFSAFKTMVHLRRFGIGKDGIDFLNISGIHQGEENSTLCPAEKSKYDKY